MTMPHTSLEDIRASRLAGMTDDDRARYETKKAELAAALRTGIAIRDLRENAGLSQTDLAARMGIAQSAFARLEAGRSNITVATMVKLAVGLQGTVDIKVGPAGTVQITSKPARRSRAATTAGRVSRRRQPTGNTVPAEALMEA